MFLLFVLFMFNIDMTHQPTIEYEYVYTRNTQKLDLTINTKDFPLPTIFVSTTFLLHSAFNPKVKLERIPIPATPPDTESESETVKTDCQESLSPNDESSRGDSPVRTQSKARQRLSSSSDSDIESIDAGNCTEDDDDTEPVPDTSNENNPDLRSISRPRPRRRSFLSGDGTHSNCSYNRRIVSGK